MAHAVEPRAARRWTLGRGVALLAALVVGVAWALVSALAVGALLADTTAAGSYRSRVGDLALVVPLAGTLVALAAVAWPSRHGQRVLWMVVGGSVVAWLALMIFSVVATGVR